MMLLRSGITMPTILKDIPRDETASEGDREALIAIIQDNIEDFDDLSLKDADVIYSVSGYVTRYIDCNCFGDAELADMSDFINFDRSHFDSMSRGGWTEPRANVLFLCTIATIAFNRLTTATNRNVFLNVQNHRAAFVDAPLFYAMFYRIFTPVHISNAFWPYILT